MSIASEISRLQTAKADIKTAIEAKGVTVPSSTTLDGYSDLIDDIPTGGDNSELIDLIERDITSIDIPSGTTKIGNYGFAGCTSLTSINIPNSVTRIGEYAFRDATYLVTVNIPSSVTTLSNYALGFTSFIKIDLSNITLSNTPTYLFTTSQNLRKIVLPSGIRTIGNSTFYFCQKLTKITIPSTVTTINQQAFYQCKALKTFICEATTPPTLSNTNAFNYTNNCPIYVPDASVDAYKAATNWSTYASRIYPISQYNPSMVLQFISSVDSSKNITLYTDDINSTTGTSIDTTDFLFTAQEKEDFISANNVGTVTIYSPITTLASSLFYNAKGITGVNLPSTLTQIQDSVFFNCTGLTTMTIPNSVTYIGGQAFSSCNNLTSITVEATTPPTLGSTVFNNTNNCPIYVPSASVNTYKTHTSWKNYASRIQAIPE